MEDYFTFRIIMTPKVENLKQQFNSVFYPQMTVELTKPYIKLTKNYKTVIKPKLLFLKSTPKAFDRRIPDESDVNNFDFDYFDLLAEIDYLEMIDQIVSHVLIMVYHILSNRTLHKFQVKLVLGKVIN